jgi:hypothetical protein
MAKKHKGLKQSLQKLEKLHGEVEQAMVDEKIEKTDGFACESCSVFEDPQEDLAVSKGLK